jgi:hypothetical protein
MKKRNNKKKFEPYKTFVNSRESIPLLAENTLYLGTQIRSPVILDRLLKVQIEKAWLFGHGQAVELLLSKKEKKRKNLYLKIIRRRLNDLDTEKVRIMDFSFDNQTDRGNVRRSK